MDYFGEDEEIIRGKKWNWKNFKSTKDYPVSDARAQLAYVLKARV